MTKEHAYIYRDHGAGLCITTDEDWVNHAMDTHGFDFRRVDLDDLPKVEKGDRFVVSEE